ncbi:MAG: NAD(P)-dependent glycerol-3-phosphate dehydrogenase [Ruminococcus flavefaciens]|nr:NAD(P)-dependent glycerol-3-phosphate dehydrogenase [Ruminococcus flavefaciens]
MADIVILGAGSFGLSLAVTAEYCGKHNVTVWSKFQEEIDGIRANGENTGKLPDVKISENIALTSDISCVKNCDILIFAVPTVFVRETARLVSPYTDSRMIIVNTGKGIESGSLKMMSDVIGEEIKTERIAVLSGPSHAEELARHIPTAVVVASKNADCAEYVQKVFSNDYLKVYLSSDVTGCEIGGALKNVIALCVGICDGMGYGDNTKSALMTRGIYETTRLGMALGADEKTFSGLTGIGDLIVTCTSRHGRNRQAGLLIGQGLSPAEAVEKTGTVEGYSSCKNAFQLARKLNIEMPITEQLYMVLFNDKDVKSAVDELMKRPAYYEAL